MVAIQHFSIDAFFYKSAAGNLTLAIFKLKQKENFFRSMCEQLDKYVEFF